MNLVCSVVILFILSCLPTLSNPELLWAPRVQKEIRFPQEN